MHPRSHEARANSLLRTLDRDALKRLLSVSEFITVEPGRHLKNAVETYDFAWFPLRGSFGIIRSENQKSIETGSVSISGAFVSSHDKDRSATELVAVTRGVILQTPLQMALETIERSPNFSKAFFLDQTANAKRSQQRVACLAFHHLSARVALWLYRLSHQSPNQTFQITQSQIAQYLGAERSRVNVCVQALCRQKAIELPHRGAIAIVNVERLAELACSCVHDQKSV